LGTGFLVAALLMLLSGLSVLRERLTGLAFLVYWMVCYLFTVLAIGMAILEAVAIRRRAREERKELIRRTFGQLGRPPDDRGHGTNQS
jgi:hypothetical protein